MTLPYVDEQNFKHSFAAFATRCGCFFQILLEEYIFQQSELTPQPQTHRIKSICNACNRQPATFQLRNIRIVLSSRQSSSAEEITCRRAETCALPGMPVMRPANGVTLVSRLLTYQDNTFQTLRYGRLVAAFTPFWPMAILSQRAEATGKVINSAAFSV